MSSQESLQIYNCTFWFYFVYFVYVEEPVCHPTSPVYNCTLPACDGGVGFLYTAWSVWRGGWMSAAVFMFTIIMTGAAQHQSVSSARRTTYSSHSGLRLTAFDRNINWYILQTHGASQQSVTSPQWMLWDQCCDGLFHQHLNIYF